MAVILTMVAAAGHAQVNQEELQQNLPNVIFLNYEGPHARVDTREQIRQIGVVLGRQIAAGETDMASLLSGVAAERRRTHSYNLRTGVLNRYFVIHCIGGYEEGKLDADIFGIGVDAAVDHIRNLRVIIQGYLQRTYNYNERDAALLAHYITVYNAVYRGNWDYMTGRFKSIVIENLIRERAGLSIRYDEWPGRTMMLIPLGPGGLSAVDTVAITDKQVIEEMRKDDDRGVPLRQQMVDLLEREAEQAERQARTEREEIRREEREIVQERQEIEQERRRVQEEEQTGRITQEESEQIQQEIERREQVVEEREREVEQRTEVVQRLEEFAEEKFEVAQQEREQVRVDQQAAIVQETAGIMGVMIERDSPVAMGSLVRLNTEGKELRRSPPNMMIHVRTLTFVGGKIIAIAGEASRAVRLIEINPTTMVIASQGDDDILTGSLLWANGNDLYAITADRHLGRFNTNLALQAKSAVNIHHGASVLIQQGRLLTQRADGTALVLHPADLTEVR